MFGNRVRLAVILSGFVAMGIFGWLALVARAAEPPRIETSTPEEVVPGVPLDGSIIIDEDLWLRLVGEPGRQMRDAHEHLKRKEYVEARQSLHNAASFLYIAHGNALPPAQEALVQSARELDRLAKAVVGQSVPPVEEQNAVFARAHDALARHHAIKAATALDDKQYVRAGSYLNSSVNHFRRAAGWSDLKLQPESVKLAKELHILGQRLIKEDSSLDDFASRTIRRLRQEIEDLGKRLIKPLEPDRPPKSSKSL